MTTWTEQAQDSEGWSVNQQETTGLPTIEQLAAQVTLVDDVVGIVDFVTIPYWPVVSSSSETWTVQQPD